MLITRRTSTTKTRIVSALLCLAFQCGMVRLTTLVAAEFTPQTDADRDLMFQRVKANRILFLGNSITLHGPAPSIGWQGNWGMAASAKDKDYVHLVLKAITETTGKEPESMVANIASFERQPDKYDINSDLKSELAFRPNIVVVAIGENVPALATEQAKRTFKASLTRLLKRLKENSNPVIVVRSCFWQDQAKDTILEQACSAVGGVFVDSSALGKDPRNAARSERKFSHHGVAGHPGDRGMRAIADVIMDALRRQ